MRTQNVTESPLLVETTAKFFVRVNAKLPTNELGPLFGVFRPIGLELCAKSRYTEHAEMPIDVMMKQFLTAGRDSEQGNNVTEHKDAVGRLGRNNRLSLIGSIVNGAAGFIAVFVLTNGLADDGAGVVFVAAAVFNIAMVSSVLGTDASLVRFIAQDRKAGRTNQIRPLLRAALRPVVFVAVLIAVLVGVFAEPIGVLFAGDGSSASANDDVTAAIRIVAVVLPFGALALSLLAATRGFGQLRTTALADLIARPILQLGAIVVVTLVGLGPAAATAAWVGPVIVSAVAAALWLRREVPQESVDDLDTSEFWSFTRPHAGTGLLRVAIRWLDTLVVAALLGVGPAGIYTASTRLLKLGDFFNQATFQSAAPQIAEDLGTGNVSQANVVYRSAATWLVLATWPLYLGSLFYAPQMLRLFGEEFVAGASALRILSATMLVASAVGPIEAVLVMSGRTTQNLVNNVTALTLNIVLGLLLIPRFGLEGAAIAWAVSLLCTNLLPVFQVYRRLGMHVLHSTHITTMAAIATGFAVTAAFTHMLNLPMVLTLVVGLGLALVPWLAFAFWQWEALALDRLLRSRPFSKS